MCKITTTTYIVLALSSVVLTGNTNFRKYPSHKVFFDARKHQTNYAGLYYTTLHEEFVSNPKDIKEMDLHNNHKGAIIGMGKKTDGIRVQQCLSVLNNGRLMAIRLQR